MKLEQCYKLRLYSTRSLIVNRNPCIITLEIMESIVEEMIKWQEELINVQKKQKNVFLRL